jgi:transcriptional regulator with XRE-family HTH domain
MKTLTMSRAEQGLTMRDLASRSGIPARIIGMAERGRYIFDIQEQQQIAQALNTEPNEIIWCRAVCEIQGEKE